MQAIRLIKRGNPRENRGETPHRLHCERGDDAGDNTARLFLALWPTEPVRRALLVGRDSWQWSRHAGRVPPQNLHLTLHFLGEIARTRVPELIEGLAVPVTSFELMLARLAGWPNGFAVWEPAACPAELTRLHDALGRALVRLAVPLETRAYRPHVTLARRARDAVAPQMQPRLTWPVDRYALVESCPSASRHYKVLRMYR